jgi:cysteinyl-tRNA synthetase
MEAAFRGAMDDDFNSALALSNLFRAAGAVNTFLDSGADVGEKAALAAAYLSEVQRVGAVLGILGESPSAYFRRGIEGLDAEAIEAHIAERSAAREAKDWERADAIRDDLARRGVILEDRPDGTTVWKVRM